ncbi:helix-turn-helix domain-containing protein [Streptomyces sp. NPDC051453]|uniref:helix-turn-helix domain-containing protein n=1 Tax=Streptomyces sp. NPDC051453 TaxID=3154941 RepID=UPI0034498DEC
MSTDDNSKKLGQFLKARRAELSPEAVGLLDQGQLRRVPGLRREEVAQLASISVQYYTRLEQGRLRASGPVLDSLAKALRLDHDQRDYLLELAAKDAAQPRGARQQRVKPQTQRLLDHLTDVPAIVLGRRMDILAWNPLAGVLLTDFSQIPEDQRNYVRLVFSESEIGGRYVNWESLAKMCVAFLRMDAARSSDDPRLSALVGELSVKDPRFRQWWAGHDVARRTSGVKKLRHPLVGDLTLDWQTFACADDPDQQLIVWTAEPDTPNDEALGFLASWAATREPEPPQSSSAGEPDESARPQTDPERH